MRWLGLMTVVMSVGAGCGKPTECERLLSDHGDDKCDANDEDKCATASEVRDIDFDWYLKLHVMDDGEEHSDTELLARRECFADRMRARGADVHNENEAALGVAATYDQMEPFLDLEAVREYQLDCWREEGPCECVNRTLAECDETPFCRPLTGDRREVGETCWVYGLPAGCELDRIGCGDAVTAGIAPDDACWVFSSTCLPRQPGWTPAEQEPNSACSIDAGNSGGEEC